MTFEEREFDNMEKTTTRAGAVRPSMVMMTGKLLGVTEGIAAMNVRIACGVMLCFLFIVATFAVNIVAFNYAKDQELNAKGMIVDKANGAVVDFHPQYVPTTFISPEISFEFLSKFRQVKLNGPVGPSLYSVDSVETLPCPDNGAFYCTGEKMYVINAAGEKVFAWLDDGQFGDASVQGMLRFEYFALLDGGDDIVQRAKDMFAQKFHAGSTRHLLGCCGGLATIPENTHL